MIDEYWIPYFPGHIIEWAHVIVWRAGTETVYHMSDAARAGLMIGGSL